MPNLIACTNIFCTACQAIVKSYLPGQSATPHKVAGRCPLFKFSALMYLKITKLILEMLFLY